MFSLSLSHPSSKEWSIPQKCELPKCSNEVVTHALFIKRLAQFHIYTIKELTSDFGLLYSLLVVDHSIGKCFELETAPDFWITHKQFSIASTCRSLNLMTPGVLFQAFIFSLKASALTLSLAKVLEMLSGQLESPISYNNLFHQWLCKAQNTDVAKSVRHFASLNWIVHKTLWIFHIYAPKQVIL